MSRTAAGLALALGASLALNGAYLLQHAGARGVPVITARHPVSAMRGLLASPIWLAGGALGLSGWALHVGALSRAPLSLVQAFVAGGLILAVPFAIGLLGHRIDRRERMAIAVMAVSLALLSVGLTAPTRHLSYDPALLAGCLALAAAISAGLALAHHRIEAGPALGLSAGALYGAADMAIKALTGAGGALDVLRSPWLIGAAACTAGAFFCFQRGLQVGRALAVIALMTAATNVVSIAGGLLVFGEPLGRTPSLAALHLGAFVLIAVAAWRLAPMQAALAGSDARSA